MPQRLLGTDVLFLHPLFCQVRVGTLPLRLMALKYGADLVYTPEVVDKGIVGAERVVNGIKKKNQGLDRLACQH